MKILSFFPVFQDSKSGLTFSGGQRRFIEICKVWSSLGNEVHIITTSYAKRLFQEFDYRTITYVFEPANFKGLGINDFVNIKRMSSMIPNEKFDFIYSPGGKFSYVITSIIAKRKLKIPIAASFNLLDPNETKIKRHINQILNKIVQGRGKNGYLMDILGRMLIALKNYIRNLFVKNFDIIFSVGSQVKKTLITVGISAERIFVVSAGIDFDRIQTIGYGRKEYDACFMGQIIPRKGIADLIESWRMVVKVKPDVKLVILGRGPQKYEVNINNLITEYDLQDNVTMLGFVLGDEKYRIMKRSRLFIFPSYLETFGQAICEVMACRLPIIAYYLPVYDEWYGDSIFSVDKGDKDELSLSILQLLENKKLRDKMGYEGQRVAKQYSWESVAKYQLEIINKRFVI